MPMQQASSSQWHYWHGRRKPARMRWHVLLLCAHCTWTKSVCLSSALICTTIHGALHGCITHQVREQCSKSVWVNEWASEWVRGRLVKDILRTNIDYYCIRIDNGFQLCSMYACLTRVCQVAVSGHTLHTHTEYRILCALYFDQSWHRSVVLLLLLYAGPFDTHDIAPAQPSAHLIIMKHANACCISPQTQSYCRSGKKSPTSYPHTVRSTWKIPSYNNNNKTITTWTKNCHRKPNRYFFHFHSHEIKNGLDFFFISLLAICSDQFLWFAVCMMYMQCMHASATCSMLRMNGPHCDVSHNSQWAEQSKTRTNK